MVILAIDSGFEKTGYAVFEKGVKHNGESFRYISSGLIKTPKTAAIEIRFQSIYKDLSKIIHAYKPEVLVLEQLFFFKNLKTAIKVAQAQGAVMFLAAQRSLRLEFLTPLQIKLSVTGYGQADKKQVQKMLGMTLKLNGELKQDDQADAIACGLAYCYLNKGLIG